MVEQLNHQFEDGGVLDLYITFLLVVLDVNHHRLSVVNAGHPCPLIRRRDGRLEEFGRSVSGLPLAIMPDYRYEMAETTLEPGETVILYTDGVTDAMNAAGDRFGDDGLPAGDRQRRARRRRPSARPSSRPCSATSPTAPSSTTSPSSAWPANERYEPGTDDAASRVDHSNWARGRPGGMVRRQGGGDVAVPD